MNITLPTEATALLALYDYTGSPLLTQRHTSDSLLELAAFYEGMRYYAEANFSLRRAMDLAFVEEVITDLSESDDIVALEACGTEEAYRIVRTCKQEFGYDALFCADELRKRAGLL